jgi:hypothetical protein
MTPSTLSPESEAASGYAAFQAEAIETAEAQEARIQNELQGMSNATVRSTAEQVRQQVKQDLRMGREYQQGRVNWITTIVMGLFHVAAFAAVLPVFWAQVGRVLRHRLRHHGA